MPSERHPTERLDPERLVIPWAHRSERFVCGGIFLDIHIDGHIGARLASRRRALRITLAEAGDAAGVTPQTVYKYEIGESRMSAERLWRLSTLLDVPVSYFFDGLPLLACAEVLRAA